MLSTIKYYNHLNKYVDTKASLIKYYNQLNKCVDTKASLKTIFY